MFFFGGSLSKTLKPNIMPRRAHIDSFAYMHASSNGLKGLSVKVSICGMPGQVSGLVQKNVCMKVR